MLYDYRAREQRPDQGTVPPDAERPESQNQMTDYPDQVQSFTSQMQGDRPDPPGFPGPGGGFPGPGGGFPGPGGGFPGPGPGFPPPFQPGGPAGMGPPLGAPPSFIPQAQPLVSPGSIRLCTFRYIYMWLDNGQQFWAWLVFVGPRTAIGWRWIGFRWVYFAVDIRRIVTFICF